MRGEVERRGASAKGRTGSKRSWMASFLISSSIMSRIISRIANWLLLGKDASTESKVGPFLPRWRDDAVPRPSGMAMSDVVVNMAVV